MQIREDVDAALQLRKELGGGDGGGGGGGSGGGDGEAPNNSDGKEMSKKNGNTCDGADDAGTLDGWEHQLAPEIAALDQEHVINCQWADKLKLGNIQWGIQVF